MQTANMKGKDETYARRLHCLPRCRQPPHRDRWCVTWRLPPLSLERVEIIMKRTRDWQDGQLGVGKWASC